MSLVGWAFFVCLGALLHHSHGHYDPTIVGLTIAFLAVVVEVVRGVPWITVGPRGTERLLAACAAFFCVLQLRNPGVIYASPGWPARVISLSIGMSAALAIGIVAITWMTRSDRIFKAGMALGLAAIVELAVAEVLVPMASPAPWIDVWVNNSAAVHYLTSGLNPYSQKYADIYQGRFGYPPGFYYLPAFLLWIAPFRLAFHDIRFALIVANWIAAGAFVLWARGARKASLIPLLACLAWLSFPVTNFVIEQSWADLALVPPAVLTFRAVRSRRPLTAGAWMGVFLSIKQYAFVGAALALLRIGKIETPDKALHTAWVASAILLATIAPFFLADPRVFFWMTVQSHASQPIRLDALTLTAYLARVYGWVLPATARIALALVGAALGALTIVRRRVPDTASPAAAAFVAYGFAFIFGKWAFCNYYFFLASFLLMYLVAPRDQERPSVRVEPALPGVTGRSSSSASAQQ